MKARFTRVLALIPLVALLSGCITYETVIDVENDANVHYSVSLSLEKSIATTVGITDLCETTGDSPVPGAVGQPFTTSKDIGCKWSFTFTLEEFNNGDSGALVHSNGEYTFSMNGADLGEDLSSAGASFDAITGFSFAVTFPGKVLTKSGSGVVSGLGDNTVTWSKLTDFTAGLSATAKDTASVTDSLLPILLIAGGAIIVVGAAIFVVLRLKKSKAQKELAAQQAAYYAQGGYGQPMPNYAPQAPFADPNAGYGAAPAPYGSPQAPYTDPNAGYGAPQQPFIDPSLNYDAPLAAGSAPADPYSTPQPPVGSYGAPQTPQPPAGQYAQPGYAPQAPVDPTAGQYPPQAPNPPQG